MGTLALAKEFWLFMRQNKKWWLLPIVAILLVLACLLSFAQTSALAPFIYTVF
jgi:drug/metabolite transporter superfamily protein YnfA